MSYHLFLLFTDSCDKKQVYFPIMYGKFMLYNRVIPQLDPNQ